MWVSDPRNDDKLYAYNLATLAKSCGDSSKDFTDTLSAAGNNFADRSVLWSDGTTMWVADV